MTIEGKQIEQMGGERACFSSIEMVEGKRQIRVDLPMKTID